MEDIVEAIETVRDFMKKTGKTYLSGLLDGEIDKARELVKLGDLDKVRAAYETARDSTTWFEDQMDFDRYEPEFKNFLKAFYEAARAEYTDSGLYVREWQEGDRAKITGPAQYVCGTSNYLDRNYPVEIVSGEPDEDGDIFVRGISETSGGQAGRHIDPASLTYIPEG
ncbi:hypothetical protein [Nocardia grenadensis]|uniref:hypothetical protein n=1 Tax=Nocardia grenadensis TaxID=931537 RepID=UPI003D736DC0